MAIDWTKPCELEDGSPVRVLATDVKGLYPVVIAYRGIKEDSEIIDRRPLSGMGNPTVRNVAPKPVRREGWVNVFVGGLSTYMQDQRIHPTKAEADRAAEKDVKCFPVHIVWHSDGSPVDDTVSKEEYDRVCVERDSAIRDLNDLVQGSQEIVDGLKSELYKRDAVINAAVSWRNEITGSGLGNPAQRLYDEVCAFTAKQVVKSCDNCANGPFCCEKCLTKTCVSGDGYDHSWANWEPKR